jgi:hypothetical protein
MIARSYLRLNDTLIVEQQRIVNVPESHKQDNKPCPFPFLAGTRLSEGGVFF